MKIYINDVLSWSPCKGWTEEKIRNYDPDDRGLTPLEICVLDGIDAEDKLWILLRPEIIAEKDLHELACQFVERVLCAERAAGREPAPASWAAIEGKRKWLRGEITDAELKQIKIAAAYADAVSAYAAYADAAYADAAYADAAAVSAYAYAAAVSADAAYADAAYADARASERKEQLKIVRNLLEERDL